MSGFLFGFFRSNMPFFGQFFRRDTLLSSCVTAPMMAEMVVTFRCILVIRRIDENSYMVEMVVETVDSLTISLFKIRVENIEFYVL